MRYALLGHCGLRVSTLCLGTMGFVGDASWAGRKVSWCSSKEASGAIVAAFLDAGGNIIDTANSYGDSEEWLGEFLGPRRHEVVISTKYGGSNAPVDVNGSGAQRKSMVRSVERSLTRLRTDYLDILSLHCWDPLTPIDEVMRALDDLIAAGKVLHIGVSNAPAWVISLANTAAQFRGQNRFSSIQVEYSLIERDVERELLPMARALDIGVMAWTPLASGWLSGKYLDGQGNGAAAPAPAATNGGQNGAQNGGHNGGEPRRLDDPIMGRFVNRNERNIKIAATVARIAAELGRTPAQVALNWLRQNGVIPIVGARTVEQIRENAASMEFDLEPAQLDELTKIGKIPLGYPHAFLNSPIVKKFVYGERWESLLAKPHHAHSLFP